MIKKRNRRKKKGTDGSNEGSFLPPRRREGGCHATNIHFIPVIFASSNVAEALLYRQRYHPRLVLRPLHRVRLSRGGLAICKHGSVFFADTAAGKMKMDDTSFPYLRHSTMVGAEKQVH